MEEMSAGPEQSAMMENKEIIILDTSEEEKTSMIRIYPKKVPVGQKQSTYLDEEDVIIILDSSDDEKKTSSKGQRRKRRRPSRPLKSTHPWIYPEDVSATLKQKTYMEEEDVLIIVDSSNDEKKTSIKSQRRKRRRISASLVKSAIPQVDLLKEDVRGKRRAKKRNIVNSAVDKSTPPAKIQKEDLDEDQNGSGGFSDVRPTGFRSTISETIRQRIQFHHVLGQGSFGTVVLAEDSITCQKFAVKILSKRAQLAKGDKSDVMVEHRVLQVASGSPFLVHTVFAFQTKMFVFLGMQYIGCGNFDKFLQSKGPLNVPSARFYAAELVCGIQFLHSKGIIHRDLKPENIMVAETGHVKITDFGLALENIYGDRIATEYAGTWGYIAPEVLDEEYNAGADWYSFGIIMSEMLTGERGYDSAYVDETGSGGDDFIFQLLQLDPSKRLGVNGNIRKHQFFQHINWVEVEALRMPPPHIPVPTKSRQPPIKFNFNTMEAAEARNSLLSDEDQAMFSGFSFSNL